MPGGHAPPLGRRHARARVERSRVACAGVYAMPARAGWGRVNVGAALQGLSSQNDLAWRRSESGRDGGWGLRLVAVTTCGAADRPIRSASGSLAGIPLSDGVGWVKVTVRRRRYFVRRRRHVRQQDSPRVSPRPACDAGCSMLHARVVFGRGWACVWRRAGGLGDGGGAGWYALQDAEEASTDAVCSQDYQE